MSSNESITRPESDTRVLEAQANLATALRRLSELPTQIAAAQRTVDEQDRALDAAVRAALKKGEEPASNLEAAMKLDLAKRTVVLLSRERKEVESSIKSLENSLKFAQATAIQDNIRARVAAADAAISNMPELVQEMLDLGVLGTLQGPNGLSVTVASGYGTTGFATVTIRVPTERVRRHPDAVDTASLKR